MYIAVCVVSFIESNDIRVKPEYTFTEKYCSYMAIYGMIFAFGFPVLITVVYWQTLKLFD